MKIYRRLNPIKAISFDLDDTLYDNYPVIVKAEQAQFDYLQNNVALAQSTQRQDWVHFRFQLLKQQPQLRHHIGQLRQIAIEQQLIQLGLSLSEAQHHAGRAFEVFLHHRQQIDIAPEILTMLQQLAEKYPLIAITNGNACVKTMGLSEVFQFTLLAGEPSQNNQPMEQKPSSDMFVEAATRLKIAPQNILHIGDSLHSDINGAHKANVMAVWINPNNKKPTTHSSLPHIQIENISQLKWLIEH